MFEDRFRFEAAHSLPRVPAGHKCRRMHGHSYEVAIVARGDDPAAVIAPLIEQLDHRCLNEISGLSNPTSEQLARWLWQRLEMALDLSEIRVEETCESACIYRGK